MEGTGEVWLALGLVIGLTWAPVVIHKGAKRIRSMREQFEKKKGREGDKGSSFVIRKLIHFGRSLGIVGSEGDSDDDSGDDQDNERRRRRTTEDDEGGIDYFDENEDELDDDDDLDYLYLFDEDKEKEDEESEGEDGMRQGGRRRRRRTFLLPPSDPTIGEGAITPLSSSSSFLRGRSFSGGNLRLSRNKSRGSDLNQQRICGRRKSVLQQPLATPSETTMSTSSSSSSSPSSSLSSSTTLPIETEGSNFSPLSLGYISVRETLPAPVIQVGGRPLALNVTSRTIPLPRRADEEHDSSEVEIIKPYFLMGKKRTRVNKGGYKLFTSGYQPMPTSSSATITPASHRASPAYSYRSAEEGAYSQVSSGPMINEKGYCEQLSPLEPGEEGSTGGQDKQGEKLVLDGYEELEDQLDVYALHDSRKYLACYINSLPSDEGSVILPVPTKPLSRGGYEGETPEERARRLRDVEEERRHAESLGDWNRRFQQILSRIASCNINTPLVARFHANRDLIYLAQDFIYSSQTYGKIIISEVYLPFEKKTIKPITTLGGWAGGDKYIVHNILFKFAFDSKGLYGSDYAAAKVAGHELKGLISYLKAGIRDVSLPLMALVDYRGFRLIAMSILPISPTTIIYGSNDMGQTIHAKDPFLNEKMRQAALKLNLKSHWSGLLPENSQVLYSASDVEGHKSSDGNYYLLDFSRVWPPETPKPGIQSAHLYRLLRPELVMKYHKPLCSDAFSGFIAHQPGCHEHNQEIREATHWLVNVVIPHFAKELVSEMKRAKREKRIEKLRLTELIHRHGINVRYLGLLKKNSMDPDLRTLIFVEMVARIIKNNLRLKLREKMEELRIPLQEPYVRLVIDYLNLVFGESAQSEQYWNTSLKEGLQAKFDDALDRDEMGVPLKCLLEKFSDERIDGKLVLFRRIQKITALEFTPRLIRDLNEHPNQWLSRGEQPFDDTDLADLGLRVKHMNIITHAQGYFFKIKGAMLWDRDPEVAMRFFRMAARKFQDALDMDPNNSDTLCNVAEVCSYFAEAAAAAAKGARVRHLANVKFDTKDPKVRRAQEYYLRAIRADPTDSAALYQYAVFLERCYKTSEAEDYYLRALEADPNNTAALHDYGNFLAELGEHDDAEKMFLRCSENSKNLARTETIPNAPALFGTAIDTISPEEIYKMR